MKLWLILELAAALILGAFFRAAPVFGEEEG